MEDRQAQLEAEENVRSMGIEQMRREKALLGSELKSIEAQISDLAFNNYGTYADAGRATQDCSKVFNEMREKATKLSSQIENMNEEFQEFRSKSKALSAEQGLVKKALDKNNPIWELLSLPSRMDVCIRAGYYDAAYSLTNYGVQLQQQSALIKNPMIKKIADRLVEARSYLLEELFNKFSGPLDLAESIKVVNNVRKMPYLTANQLRTAILQHRDMYLDKQILDISGHSDFAMQAIEVYRTCMYDTLVLYLAVFPENEVIRKDPSVDPRWESWPVLPPSAILSQWAKSNIKRLLDLISKADTKSPVDVSSVQSKLMVVASSFGRMGIDFRPLIVSRITRMVEERFKHAVRHATIRFMSEAKTIAIINVDASSLPTFESAPDAPPVPLPELSLWDDLTIYANDVVEALNTLRFVLTPILLETVVAALRDSLKAILSFLATSHSKSPNFAKAIRIVCVCLMPFLEKCVTFFFPPRVASNYFGLAVTKHEYDQFVELNPKSLAACSDSSDAIEEVLLPMLQKKKPADVDLHLHRKTDEPSVQQEEPSTNVPPPEEHKPDPRFFLDGNDDEEENEQLTSAEDVAEQQEPRVTRSSDSNTAVKEPEVTTTKDVSDSEANDDWGQPFENVSLADDSYPGVRETKKDD